MFVLIFEDNLRGFTQAKDFDLALGVVVESLNPNGIHNRLKYVKLQLNGVARTALKDRTRRTVPLRRTCSRERRALRWRPCMVACAGCSIPLGLVAILFLIHLAGCMAEEKIKTFKYIP